MYDAEKEIQKLIQDAITKLSIAFEQISVTYEQETIEIDNFDCLLHDIDGLILILQRHKEIDWTVITQLNDLINKDDDNRNIESNHLMCRKITAEFLLKLYLAKEGIEDEEKYINSLTNICNKITRKTHEEYSIKEDLYYKNILSFGEHRNFEEMTDLLKAELTSYDINLFYCEKIIDFINNELSQQQVVFSMNLYFIEQFINNSFFAMILTSTKLFSNAKLNQSKNFGFDYLKHYISQSCNDDDRIVQTVHEICGGEVRSLIKRGKELCKEIDNLRNYYVAHYDILKLEEIRKIKLDVKLFEEIYDIAVRIFEILSLRRFHRLDTAHTNLIKFQGFKKNVCQNVFLRGNGLSDIDIYLNYLRKNYLIPKNE